MTTGGSTSPSRLPIKGSSLAPDGSRNSQSMAGLGGGKPGRAAPVRCPARETTAEATGEQTSTARPAVTTRVRATMARPPSHAGPSSTTSTATVNPGETHTRAKSSATTLTSATTLQPPWRETGSTSSSVATRPAASALSHGRLVSGASSSMSTVSASTTPGSSKPAFTAYQQHFTPAKPRQLVPKPMTSTFLAPPSPSKLRANVAASAETWRLQTELLQLHLLHHSAQSTDAAWRASAREKLAARFQHAVSQQEKIQRLEAVAAEDASLGALTGWSSSGGGPASSLLDAKIQSLDTVLCGLWCVGETPGGRYARVVRRFEQWAGRLRAVEEAREQCIQRDGQVLDVGDDDLLFAGELDRQWKEDVAYLVRRLDDWRRLLREADAAALCSASHVTHRKSAVAAAVEACVSLVHDMLAELSLMEQMERDAVAHEKMWVRRMNGVETPSLAEAQARAGAIWRAF